MYEPHDTVFQPPTNPSISIWRYMDLAKLISLLASSTLWFSRTDMLGDPHEGSVGRATHELREELERQFEEERAAIPDLPPIPEGRPGVAEALANMTRRMARESAVNCWYMDEEESVAMWRGYAGLTTGVAVKATYQRFCDSLQGTAQVHVGTVHYIDPDTEAIPTNNLFWPLLHKRRAFAYERELRAVTRFEGAGSGMGIPEPPVGIAIPVDLRLLIDAVVVGPDQAEWFYESVERVVDAFAPHVEVRKSFLDTDPLY